LSVTVLKQIGANSTLKAEKTIKLGFRASIMMDKLRARISKCMNYEIDLRLHVTHFRMISEQINENDILQNLEDLKNLKFDKLKQCVIKDANKYALYFLHTKHIYHKYVIDIRDNEKKIRVVTVHKIHDKSQKRFEKYVNK